MTTYYVDYSVGSDNNSSTQAQSISTPWKTPGYAVNQLSAGDTLYFLDTATFIGGFNVNVSGTSGNPITLAAYTGDKPVIDGEWRDNGTPPDYKNGHTSGFWDSLVEITGDWIVVDGLYFTGSGSRCLGTFQADNVTIKNCVCWENIGSGIDIDTSTNITVEDCDVFYSSLCEETIGRYHDRWSLDGSHLYVNHPPPMMINKSRGVTVKNTDVHDSGGEGIDIYASRECTVQDCRSWNNTRTQGYIDWAGRDSTFERCAFFCTDAHRAWREENGMTLRDERHGSGAQKGNIDGLSKGVTVVNCIVVNCAQGLFWTKYANLTDSPTKSSYVGNNTFVNNTFGLQMTGQPVISEPDDRSWEGFIFENNLFADNTKHSFSTPTKCIVRNNLWESKSINSSFKKDSNVYGDPLLSDPDAAITSTLGLVRYKVTGEYTAGDSYTVTFNPADYYLTGSSTAIGAGRTSSRTGNVDYRGADRTAPFDIGAHQFDGEETPTLSADFTLSAYNVEPGTTVNITDASSAAMDVFAYHWSLDNATWTSIGTSQNETFTPTLAGDYTIRQQVTDTDTSTTKEHYEYLKVTSITEDPGDDGGDDPIPSAENLLTNGDFASGSTGWSFSTYTGSPGSGVTGERAYISGTGGKYLNQSGFTMLDGGEYIYSFQLELTGASGDPDKTVEIHVIQDGAPNDDVITRLSVVVPNNGGPVSFSDVVTQILGSDETDCRLRFKSGYLNSGQTLFIDNVVLAPYVEVTAGITASTTTPGIGDTVDFTDTGSGANKWTWEIKSGSGEYEEFSRDQNPSLEFVWNGVFTVRLTAENTDNGNSAQATETITVSERTDYFQVRLRRGLRWGMP